MIELCYGKDTLGVFDTIQRASDFASGYAYKIGIHHNFDWPEIRHQAAKVSSNLSISISGFGFRVLEGKVWPNLDMFQQAALDMADETEKLRREYGSGGEHPKWPRLEWKDGVNLSETQLGYWEWVVHRVQSSQE